MTPMTATNVNIPKAPINISDTPSK